MGTNKTDENYYNYFFVMIPIDKYIFSDSSELANNKPIRNGEKSKSSDNKNSNQVLPSCEDAAAPDPCRPEKPSTDNR